VFLLRRGSSFSRKWKEVGEVSWSLSNLIVGAADGGCRALVGLKISGRREYYVK